MRIIVQPKGGRGPNWAENTRKGMRSPIAQISPKVMRNYIVSTFVVEMAFPPQAQESLNHIQNSIQQPQESSRSSQTQMETPLHEFSSDIHLIKVSFGCLIAGMTNSARWWRPVMRQICRASIADWRSKKWIASIKDDAASSTNPSVKTIRQSICTIFDWMI